MAMKKHKVPVNPFQVDEVISASPARRRSLVNHHLRVEIGHIQRQRDDLCVFAAYRDHIQQSRRPAAPSHEISGRNITQYVHRGAMLAFLSRMPSIIEALHRLWQPELANMLKLKVKEWEDRAHALRLTCPRRWPDSKTTRDAIIDEVLPAIHQLFDDVINTLEGVAVC